MMVSRQTSNTVGDDDGEGLRNVIRLEKVSDDNISDIDAKHIVHGGPFHGVIVRQPLDGETYFLNFYPIISGDHFLFLFS